MSFNISNKEYNFFSNITAFLEYAPVIMNSHSFLTVRNFIVVYQSEGDKVNEIVLFVKCNNVNLPLPHRAPQVEFLYISRTA